MDYEKKYKKKLDDARYWHDVSEGDIPAVLEEIFPELKESEDEMIRKDIVEAVELHKGFTQERKEYIYDWLEKQGEQKPAWSEEDERMFDYALDMIEWYSGKNGDKSKLVSDWLKSIKDRVQPKQEWSKEDKERFISCLKRLGSGNPEQSETINSKWFKEHVYPQSQWKPSDEQMDALHYVTNFDYGGHKATLVSLYEQLKKLKG